MAFRIEEWLIVAEYSSISRALGLFQVLAREPKGLPLGEIALRTDLAKSVTHRLLGALVRDGYVNQDPTSQRYELTLRLPALGFRFLGATRLTDVCQPILDHLAQRAGELVQLAIIDGESLIWVAWAQGSRSPLRYVPVLVRNVVLTAAASGEAWLAELPEDDALSIIRKHGFPDYGARPVRNEKEFLAKLRAAKARGYGMNLEAGEPGINAIAVPIRADLNPTALVVGALAVAGPAVRFGQDKFAEILPALRTAAAGISEIWPMHSHLRKSGGGYIKDMDAYESNYP